MESLMVMLHGVRNFFYIWRIALCIVYFGGMVRYPFIEKVSLNDGKEEIKIITKINITYTCVLDLLVEEIFLLTKC